MIPNKVTINNAIIGEIINLKILVIRTLLKEKRQLILASWKPKVNSAMAINPS
ncbi:hypothetical protein N752_01550 [Desulforamulus aquiferis]|nr:hypothetical protein N752_01550 [Desulforamulus aquiferis]